MCMGPGLVPLGPFRPSRRRDDVRCQQMIGAYWPTLAPERAPG
jgi:hypothetical protein